MLAGVVQTPEQRLQAGNLTREIKDVNKVFNEMKVIKKIDKKKASWKISSMTR
jgi:osmotically-inducible protein OsmY